MQTTKNGLTIIVADDEPEIRNSLRMSLEGLGYDVELTADGDEALARLQASPQEIAAVVLDIQMPHRDGLEALREIRDFDSRLPVIMTSGASSTLDVVAAMKSGATDFLEKPIDADDLERVLTRALGMRGMSFAPASRKAVAGVKSFVSSSPRMQEIQALVPQVGWSEAPVLIQGETGSGKEVLARELHAHSPRADKPFFKLNCAALPSELVESELFGYERGAFTGAFQKKSGMFEMADGGTLLLDEIGDMDVRLQAKLLQVLQDHEFHRIGGKGETIKVDVRIIAATHRDLEQRIVDGTFREDLYYRLNVINLKVPPLRDRSEDLLPLAEFLIRKHTVRGIPAPAFTFDLRHAVTAYHWPGNVRELENVIQKLMILRAPDLVARELHAKTARGSVVAISSTEGRRTAEKSDTAPILEQVTKSKQRAEAEAIVAALDSTHWNRKQAALLLKIDYKALLYKMKKLGVDSRKPIEAEHITARALAVSGGGS